MAAHGGGYVLGSAAAEQERLRLQHELWLPAAVAAWHGAGLATGQRVLDLGAGPGFCALELARAVGPAGRVLALESSDVYVATARASAAAAGLSWLEVRGHDLAGDALPLLAGEAASFDLAWCRWVAMFLPALDPLLALLAAALRPGGRVVAHEYVHWESFGLHPHGEAIARFGAAVMASFLEAGGDPDVNRRLPGRLAARSFTIEELRLLPVLGRGDDPWARWLERFVTIYGRELLRQRRWTAADADAAAAEMAAARRDPGSFWVGPTVLELRARNGASP
jgi:SAM-dependent methyltransferase